uniref:Uncharacterized protein n=1 Tax=Arundo donax TaxID=35708 RepID=A0A0A9F398_ARUDO
MNKVRENNVVSDQILLRHYHLLLGPETTDYIVDLQSK